MKIDLKIIDERIGTEFPLPSYAKEGDAAIDLRAMIDEPIKLHPGDTYLIDTGIAVGMPNSEMAAIILPRSGEGGEGLVIGNLTGLIDSGYRGTLKVLAWNRNKVKYKYSWKDKRIFENRNKNNPDIITINKGDRLAQMAFVPIIQAEFNIVEKLSETDRGENGFGSSGKNEFVDKTEEKITLEDDGDVMNVISGEVENDE